MKTLVGTPDPEPLPNGNYRVFVMSSSTGICATWSATSSLSTWTFAWGPSC